MNTTTKGKIAEKKAIKFLRDNNFEVIDINFYSKFGEIDIIAKKDNIYHFIEVKSGKNFEPIYNITYKKLNKIIKTIDWYFLKNNINPIYQIDAIIIKNHIEFIPNITQG